MSDLSVDIGSEFVHIAVETADGRRIANVSIGGRSGVEATLAAIDASLNAWSVPLARVETVRIASTEAINALLARRGPRIALMTTQGFGDCLWLGRQNRADLYDPIARSPAPTFLVDRRDTFEIAGRIDAQGKEVAPVDEAAIRAAALEIHRRGIATVAVCLLFAHVNPRHEQRCRELIGDAFPDIEVCLSHEVDPQPREYERTVSACLEAWLRPLLAHTLTLLHQALSRRGFVGRLLLADGRGHLSDIETARSCVSPLVAGGPAASVRCAAVMAASIKAPTAIALDIGSTSTDLCLIDHGEPRVCHGATYAGVPLRQSMLDLASIELGGRSRCVRDHTGRIGFVAGRDTRAHGATLSDALLVAGRIPDDGSRDTRTAWSVFGGSVGAAGAQVAAGEVVEAAEREVAAALLNYAVRRNVDPALATLVAMGGLGAILGPGAAALLRIPQLVTPGAPAAAGAIGLLGAQSSFEEAARIGAWTDALPEQELRSTLERLAATARGKASRQGWASSANMRTTVEIAPTPHMHPSHVTLEGLPRKAADIAAAFRAQHLDRFGVLPPERNFIFSLTVSLAGVHKGAASAPDMLPPAVQIAGYSEPVLFRTVAGAIWKPPGWCLESIGDCYLLRREAQS